MTDRTASNFFVAGGSLAADADSYVVRQADRDLQTNLREGRFCYVLDARQVGKSSLMVRVAAQLRADGDHVVVLDLSGSGQHLSIEQWYYGLLFGVGEQLGIEEALEAFWLAHQSLGISARFFTALRQIALPNAPGRLVIFVDEIDAVKSVPFSTDEFFAGIRECHNRRSRDAAMHDLVFCLLGVATPASLVQSPQTTPFNIGQRVELADFTSSEAAALARGLGAGNAGKRTLAHILHWTGGHPYLTQRLCMELAANPKGIEASFVNRACRALFLSPQARTANDNLTFVQDRLLDRSRNPDETARMLDLYGQVRRSSRPLPIPAADTGVSLLHLSGILRIEAGTMQVRNRIYAKVFDIKWIRLHLPQAEVVRQRAAFVRGLVRASLLWGILLILVAMALSGQVGWRHASDALSQIGQQVTQLRRQKQNLQQSIDAANQQVKQTQVDADRIGDQLVRNRADLTGLRQAKERVQRQNVALYQESQGYRRRSAFWEHEGQDLQTLAEGLAGGEILAGTPVANGTLAVSEHVIAEARRKHRPPPALALQVLERSLINGKYLVFKKELSAPVTAAAYSLDGSRLLVATSDQQVRVCEGTSGKDIVTISQAKTLHQRPINSVAFSDSGTILVTASNDCICTWNASNGEFRQSVAANPNVKSLLRAIVSPDERTIAATHLLTEEPCLLDAKDLVRPARLLKGYQRNVTALGFSPQGTYLAAGGSGPVVLWDVKQMRVSDSLEYPQPSITAMAVNPRAPTVAFGGVSGSVTQWSRFTETSAKEWPAHTGPVNAVAYSPDGSRLVTAGQDRKVRIWNTEDYRTPIDVLENYAGAVTVAQFAPDGRHLATAAADRTLQVWYLPETTLTGIAPRMLYAEYSHDCRMVVAAGSNGRVGIWEANSLRPMGILACDPLPVYHAAFSPASDIIATGQKGSVRLWTVAKLTHNSVLSTAASELVPGLGVSGVICLRFSPDGRQLGCSEIDGRLRIWDRQKRRIVWDVQAHTREARNWTFSPDGMRVATAGADGAVRLWYVGAVKPYAECRGHAGGVWFAAFSPDGKRVLSADEDGTVGIWDSERGVELGHLGKHPGQVLAAVWSPDGSHCLTACLDNAVRVWEVSRPKVPEMELFLHRAGLMSVNYAPDGTDFVTASADGTARVFPASEAASVMAARRLIGRLKDTTPAPLQVRTADLWDTPHSRAADLALVGVGAVHPEAFRATFATLGGATVLGIPRNRAVSWPDDGMEMQEFSGGRSDGVLFYPSAAGAVLWFSRPVWRELVDRTHVHSRDLGLPLRGEHGELGEIVCPALHPGIDGARVRYERGQFVFCPTHGGVVLIDMVWRSYVEAGGHSALGCPFGNEQVAVPSPQSTSGLLQRFEHGTVYRSRHGCFAVHGTIGTVFEDAHGTAGAYGFPTSRAALIDGHWQQEFEGGTIVTK